MNAILRLFQAIFSKGSQLFGLKSVVDKFFNKNKEGANNIVKTDFNKDRFVERFFGPDSASSPSDDASDVFTPDPLMSLGGGAVLPLDSVVPNIDSTPLQDSSLSSIVNQINKINANIDAIRDAMLQSSVIEAGYRQKLIEDLEQKLADRGGERSGRRNERRKFNFLRNAARKFIQTKNTIAKNPFLSAAVGGIGLEILGNLVDRNKTNKIGNDKKGNDKTAFNPSNNLMISSLSPSMYGAGSRNTGNLIASAQPLSGLFSSSPSNNIMKQNETIANNFGDIDENLSVLNGLVIGDANKSVNGFSNVVNNLGAGGGSNMSFVSSSSGLVKPVGSRSGITVLDLRTKSSDQPGNDISKSVPVFGSDVTSSEPSMGDWEIYLSKGRI